MTAYCRSLQNLSCAPELDFLRDAFLYATFGQELVSACVIPSSQMCAEYNRWRSENGMKETVSSKSFTMKMVSHGSAYGIGRDTSRNSHNSFVVDADKLRAALAPRP